MNWILSQIDVKGRRIYEKIGENPPSVGCAVCWYGDWGFYLTLLYFSMAVPYAYLGFKATNKSKRKPEMELFSNSVFFWRERKICYEGLQCTIHTSVTLTKTRKIRRQGKDKVKTSYDKERAPYGSSLFSQPQSHQGLFPLLVVGSLELCSEVRLIWFGNCLKCP